MHPVFCVCVSHGSFFKAFCFVSRHRLVMFYSTVLRMHTEKAPRLLHLLYRKGPQCYIYGHSKLRREEVGTTTHPCEDGTRNYFT